MDATFTELMNTANALADAARGAILPYFRTTQLETDNKLSVGFDPVTIADRAAELAMRDVLARLRPRDAIIGEEFGTSSGESGLTWVLDPIDGTRGFMSGTPTWGVLIAVADRNGPILGIIDQPYTGERFCGAQGRAWMEGPAGRREMRVLGARPLAQAIVFSTFPEIGTAAERDGFQAVAKQAQLVRYGMDCYAYALLAAGHIDLVIEAGLSNYDVNAPIAVIEAAGGIVTDWQGGKAHEGGRILAAAGHRQHQAALEILSKVA